MTLSVLVRETAWALTALSKMEEGAGARQVSWGKNKALHLGHIKLGVP